MDRTEHEFNQLLSYAINVRQPRLMGTQVGSRQDLLEAVERMIKDEAELKEKLEKAEIMESQLNDAKHQLVEREYQVKELKTMIDHMKRSFESKEK